MIHEPDHLRVGGRVEARLEEPDCRDGGAVVVERREEAVVAAHVEHVDQTVAARRRQQAENVKRKTDNLRCIKCPRVARN